VGADQYCGENDEGRRISTAALNKAPSLSWDCCWEDSRIRGPGLPNGKRIGSSESPCKTKRIKNGHGAYGNVKKLTQHLSISNSKGTIYAQPPGSGLGAIIQSSGGVKKLQHLQRSRKITLGFRVWNDFKQMNFGLTVPLSVGKGEGLFP